MKRTIILAATFLLSVAAAAQQDSHQLQETVVKGARVITKADRSIIHPSDETLKSATSGYSLLAKLALPGIKVDVVSHTVTSSMNDGAVQLRINGIVADKAGMMSVDMDSVVSIEFIDNPGVRYGDGIAKVINIKTRRAANGYALGADLSNSLTSRIGSNMAFAKYNQGKNEFSASYNNSYTDISRFSTSETASYLLADNTTRTITRQGIDQQSTNIGHQLQFCFNRKQGDSHQLQAKLTADFTNFPISRSRKLITDGGSSYYSTYDSGNKSVSPVLDLYYEGQIDSAQTVRMNAVGTYINSDYDYFYDEGQPVSYSCGGRTYSLMSEAVYENRLHPFTLTAGLEYQQKYVRNGYTGSVEATNSTRFSNIYAFAQLSGRLFNCLSYVAGIGMSHVYFRQESRQFDFTLFRPKMVLQYPLGSGFSVRYSFERSQHVSKIANTSDITVRTNSMELEVGNPDLRPNARTEHSLRLSLDAPRLSSFIQAAYRRNSNCNMDKYIRTEEAFIHTQRNQEQCSMLYCMASADWFIIPKRLSVGCQGSVCRFINIGDDYRHFYTSANWQAMVNAYLGKLSLTASADNGWNFMEGEREGHYGHSVYVTASYAIGDFNFSLTWQQPFESNYKNDYAYIRNRYVSKCIEERNGAMSNLLTFGVTWKISHGRKYKAVNKTLNHADKETGIMKM